MWMTLLMRIAAEFRAAVVQSMTYLITLSTDSDNSFYSAGVNALAKLLEIGEQK
jgi:hypothetical protein